MSIWRIDGCSDFTVSIGSVEPADSAAWMSGRRRLIVRWGRAAALREDDDHTWAEVAKAYETIDSLAVLPIHRRLVEHELFNASAQHYQRAARRLARMRKLAADTDQADVVDTFITELRERHRRRPRLQQEFDRARLP